MSTRSIYKFALWMLLGICCVSFALLFVRRITAEGQTEENPSALHFIAVLPDRDDGITSVKEQINDYAERYGLEMETHTFSTVTEQRQMLRLVPNIESDGLLFWPISSNEADYQDELSACCEKGVPIVVIDRDIAADLRSSFIGSGVDSDLLVLSQRLRGLSGRDTFMVGDRSGSGANQVAELLMFSAENPETPAFVPRDIQSMKLQRLAESPPEGWYTYSYLRLDGEDARSLQLKYKIIELILSEDPSLIFTLDSDLTVATISAKSSLRTHDDDNPQILGYGTISENANYLTQRQISGLITSKPEVSAAIGIRYLRDLNRGLWVPESHDSGINYITPDTLSRHLAAEGNDHE